MKGAFRSAEGWSEGEAGATELPSFASPKPSAPAQGLEIPPESCQAPKPPNSMQTKRKIAAH